MSSNQLSGSIPAELSNLTKLTELYLHHNQLSGSVPSELGKLTNLTKLYLDHNQFSGNIPPELGNLDKLKTLSLDINHLSGSIPRELANAQFLQNLFLAFNELSGPIPPKIADHFTPGFSIFALKHNKFTFDGTELLAQKSYSNYFPQDSVIPVHVNDGALSVSAGGTLSHNTYQWHEITDSGTIRVAGFHGDSVFHPSKNGNIL